QELYDPPWSIDLGLQTNLMVLGLFLAVFMRFLPDGVVAFIAPSQDVVALPDVVTDLWISIYLIEGYYNFIEINSVGQQGIRIVPMVERNIFAQFIEFMFQVFPDPFQVFAAHRWMLLQPHFMSKGAIPVLRF